MQPDSTRSSLEDNLHRTKSDPPQPAETNQALNVIRLKQVSKVYGKGEGRVTALEDISLDITTGEFIAIMGPSGSGKSTLLHCAAALDSVSSGSVIVAGHDVNNLRDGKLTKLRSEKIGFIFQAYNLIPILSVEQNILLPLKVTALKKVASSTRARFHALIQALDLGQCLKRSPLQLSGGQQQKVAVARALITRPAIVFADEPTGNLDSKSSTELLGLLSAINQHYSQTIVMITHSAQAASYAGRVVFIKDGRLIGQIAGRLSAETINQGLAQLEQK